MAVTELEAKYRTVAALLAHATPTVVTTSAAHDDISPKFALARLPNIMEHRTAVDLSRT